MLWFLIMLGIPYFSAQLLDAEILPLIVTISGRVSSETPINCEFSGLRGVIVEETVRRHKALISPFYEDVAYVILPL